MVTKTHTITKTKAMSNIHPRKTQDELRLELPELSSSKAGQASKERWKLDLGSLLKNAQKRFADIAWAVEPGGTEEIWAHKAIIYARASGQFQLKYLSAPAPPPHSRLSILPTGSSISFLPYQNSFRSNTPQSSLAHSHRPPSPGGLSLTSLAGSVRQVAFLNGTDSNLFQSILEALYTANGLSEVFAFLFDDHAAGDSPEARISKLQKDLLYMWRSKLYADCRIVLVSQPDLEAQAESNSGDEEAVFSAHRSILCSRSPYFASLLLDPYADSKNRVFTLASPPFTPASLHFSLGYLYCGTLEFSNRNFDLATAMQIWRSAQYLGLELLREEVETKISDMCHNFKDMCKYCVSRIGRVYAFSLALDVNSKRLEKATVPFVVNHFGIIWNKAIGELHYEAQTDLVDLVCLSIDPNTVIAAIRNSKKLKEKLANERSDWSDHLLSMLEPIDEQIGVILQTKFPAVVTSKGFLDLLVGVGFSNDVLERALIILVTKLTEDTAAETYQVLVGQVLLREDGLPMDARVIVEDAKAGVLKFLKKHWTSVKALNGFDPLENWALKEIADEIEKSVDDLLLSASNPPALRTRTGLKVSSPTVKSVAHDEGRSVSAASLRASVLSRNANRQQQPSALVRVVKKSSSTASTATSRNRPTLVSDKLPSASESSSSVISRQKLATNSPKPVSVTTKTAPRRLSEGTASIKSLNERRQSISRASNHSILSPTSPSRLTAGASPSSPLSPPPLPPVPGSHSKRPSPSMRSSRPPTPTPITNTDPKSNTSRTATESSRARKPSEASSIKSKPPRVRTTTSTSVISSRSSAASATSVRSNATTSASSTRKITTSRPPSVRKTTSSLSMRSDTSNTTIGARNRQKRTLKPTNDSSEKNSPDLSATAARKKTAAIAAALSNPKRPDRLRTTSATARTNAAASVRSTAPTSPYNRPSSVTSVRTAISTAAKALHSSSKGKGTAAPSRDPSPTGSSSGRTSKLKSKARTGIVAPPLPIDKSVTPKSSDRLPLSISPRATKARRPLEDEISSSDRSEVIADQPTDSESSDMYTHKSKGSTASVSTVRMPYVEQKPTSHLAPPKTFVIPPSNPQSMQHIGGTQPLKPPGTTLLIGIPCVVATTNKLEDGMVQPIKFRAVVKYLGEAFFGPGQWVGVEVAEKEDMPKKDWNDGTVDGVRYFELGQESKESKLRLFRNLSATPSGERSPSSNSNHLNGGGSGSNHSEEGGSVNSLRPSFFSSSHRSFNSEHEEKATRGLFVRPQEVIFVF
ncbi:hypothetical protein BY996DRAFT_4579021 [Phakopsora pachyrhizi]|nr:hypothetical protein BY996DRAFT_4579021 [Phakopsora pachyrhizi]